MRKASMVPFSRHLFPPLPFSTYCLSYSIPFFFCSLFLIFLNLISLKLTAPMHYYRNAPAQAQAHTHILKKVYVLYTV